MLLQARMSRKGWLHPAVVVTEAALGARLGAALSQVRSERILLKISPQ
jgi:hypothetical protein